jgi:hypothetical protein
MKMTVFWDIAPCSLVDDKLFQTFCDMMCFSGIDL